MNREIEMDTNITYWLMPSNPEFGFDVEKAFKENSFVEWDRKNNKICINDIVYIYTVEPFQAIRFKTKVTKIVENILTLELVKILDPKNLILNFYKSLS